MKIAFQKSIWPRLAVPLLIILIILLTLISEMTYRRTETTLTGGIKLTDVRIGAARLLQLLTDAETAQRGYLLTGKEDYIEALHHTQRQFNESIGLLAFISGIGATGPADAQHIRVAAAALFAELDRAVALARSGDRDQAAALVRSDSGKVLRDELHGLFQIKLKEAALLQQGARDRIYAALQFNRLAVLGLSLVVAVGLYLHLRQSRLLERGRLDYQQSLEKEVADQSRGLRTLAAWLETAREDEKSRLARELHDELGAILTAAKLTMARLRGKLAGDPEIMQLTDTVNLRLNEGIALKRRIIEDLRPSALSILGLHVALRTLCAETAQQSGIQVRAEITPVQISPNAELAVFRVVQEALTNVAKYAKATEVLVRLEQSADQVQLEVADNGLGFTVGTQQAGQHGLAGMQFRMESHGGSLSVVSAPQQGVRINATLPALAAVARLSVGAASRVTPN